MSWQFQYDDDDHDHGEKSFLGETGDFSGADVVDIICKQEATPRFIARHMYHFFVADDVPVPQWPYTPPRDPDAIETMSQAYFDSGYNIKAMLRTMFNSDFFKSEDARFARIKSPLEMVVGTLRMVGGLEIPSADTYQAAKVCSYMGQDLLNPPNVEGWYGGPDWINTGSQVERVNFASKMMGDSGRPGLRSTIDRIKRTANGGPMPAEPLVDACLDVIGPLPVSENTRRGLVAYAERRDDAEDDERIVGVLQLVAATQEFQLA